eukprot:6631146-Ditylum_brightwellii.AAC.1
MAPRLLVDESRRNSLCSDRCFVLRPATAAGCGNRPRHAFIFRAGGQDGVQPAGRVHGPFRPQQ